MLKDARSARRRPASRLSLQPEKHGLNFQLLRALGLDATDCPLRGPNSLYGKGKESQLAVN